MNAPIAEPMTDNEALRFLLAELRAQNQIALGKYDTVQGARNLPVNSISPYIRAANPKALKTVITNQGAADACIFENNILVYILAPKKTWVSPLNGAGTITVKCLPTFFTTVAVTTYATA